MQELEGSMYKLKQDSAFGPDYYFTVLFIKSHKLLKDKLLEIINQSWEQGKLPINWRRANVKFIKKSYRNQTTISPLPIDQSALPV